MPFIPKSTGIPTVDKVFKEVFAILNRFQGGKVASSSDEPVDWADIVNKPTTFPPESHTQDISTINNLQTALDSKEPVIALGTGNKYLFRDKTWKEVDWSEIINKPSTYSPTSHIHAIADITNLQAALDDKQPVHANLTSISNLSTTPSGRFLVTNGSAIVARPLQNSDLPAIAITDTFVVASQSAMLALSAAERGDVAVRTDLNKSFILKGDNPASLSDWQELLSPTDAVLSVDGRTGVVSLADKYQPLDSDLTVIAGLTHSNRHVMVSNGSSWTRRALEEADLPSLSISKITGLQTALDSKEPAITGTANKVLSIQADGSGVKTGSIYDDGNLVGFEKAFIGNSSSTGIRHYHDVYLYSNPNPTDTGILKIVMPQGWTNAFQRITIKGYNYAGGQGAWECIIGGYSFTDEYWHNYSAEIRGSAPFSTVRLGYDGSKCVILLGTTETVWRYAKVAISDILVGSAIYGWETGWSASIITSETGLTKIVTPPVNSGVSADWNALINKPTGTTNYITMFTNGATGAIGNSQLVQNPVEVTASKGFTSTDYLQSNGPLYTRSHTYLLNKTGDVWLNLITRNVSGSEAVADLSNVGSIDGVGPITLSDGVGGYFQLYNNSGQGRAMLKANTNMQFTVESSTLPAADAITIDRDAGSLGDGIPKVDINAVTSMNEKVYIQSDVNISHSSVVCLSGAVRYDYIPRIAVPTIDADNYPGVYLISSYSTDHTLTGGAPAQRIFVGNLSSHVHLVEGYRIEPGQFRDFLKSDIGWIASGASISGKTISVTHGTGNISVRNVSTVYINYSPTSTYTLTDGYVGQRVTVVVLGSAQHWIQGATKGHKIVAGEFRDFIYTTDGWVASAADY